jgi:hypothetical protein
MLLAPPALLEGRSLGHPPSQLFIPQCPKLDREVHVLHCLARSGAIPVDVAERQINAYLLAAGTRDATPKQRRWLVLPVTDAPHHSLLPDLGHVIHRALIKCALPGSLSAVLEQCVPCLRHTPRPIQYTDSQDVFLNLTLALLIGLYPGGAIKRPCFSVRADVYARIHALLTSPREAQTEFCLAHPHVILLACMEYTARVIPAHMPPLANFLTEKDTTTPVFFRRISILCDELRQGLDNEPATPCWAQIQSLCAVTTERITRLKKAGVHPSTREPSLDQALLRHPAAIPEHWAAPRLLGSPSLEEYRLLGQSLGLQGMLLYHIQREVQVYPLPGNIRRMQERALARGGIGNARSTFLRTRHFMCMHCALTQKSVLKPRLRLDTLRQTLVCSTCAGESLMSINMVGRILRHKRQFFYLCPGCTSIQAYEGEQLWREASCSHRHHPAAPGNARHTCGVCSEAAGPHTAQRVDHLTGLMRDFSFCQRHLPRPDQLLKCVNARQLGQYCA